MLYKILEKYSISKSELNIIDCSFSFILVDEKKILNNLNQELINNFMDLYDKLRFYIILGCQDCAF